MLRQESIPLGRGAGANRAWRAARVQRRGAQSAVSLPMTVQRPVAHEVWRQGRLRPAHGLDSPDIVPSARALLEERDLFLSCSGPVALAERASRPQDVQSVAMGWQMYALARQTPQRCGTAPSSVNMISGLAAFVPVFLLTLPAGEHRRDRYDRQPHLELVAQTGTEILSAADAWRSPPSAMSATPLNPCCLASRLPCLAPAGPSTTPPAPRLALCWCPGRCCPAPSPGTRWHRPDLLDLRAGRSA